MGRGPGIMLLHLTERLVCIQPQKKTRPMPHGRHVRQRGIFFRPIDQIFETMPMFNWTAKGETVSFSSATCKGKSYPPGLLF